MGKGVRVQSITTEFGVRIKFPEKSMTSENDGEADLSNGQSPVTEAVDETPKPCDIIAITGRSDKCEAAKAALLALVPVTAEVNVPVDLHRFIIGMKGKDVREMMTTYDVNIKGNAQWDCSPPFLPSIHPSHPIQFGSDC